MGKTLVIKGADFAGYGVDWEQIPLTFGNYKCNWNTGALENGTTSTLFVSTPIKIARYKNVYGQGAVGGGTIVMFYSGFPTISTSTSLFISTVRTAATTSDSPVEVPANAEYMVVVDQGTNAMTLGANSLYYKR